MSIAGLLDNYDKPWANVYVNNVNLPTTTPTAGSIIVNGNPVLSAPSPSTIFLGQNAGNTNYTNNNTGVGNNSLRNVSGGQNTCIGMESGVDIVNGANNVCIGYSAGQNLVAGESNNIIISNNATAGDNGQIKIGTQGLHTQGRITGAITFGNTSNNTEGIKLENNTASYTPSLFNYYEEISGTITFSGTVNTLGTYSLTRIGRMVHLRVGGFSFISTSTNFLNSDAFIPVRFRPAQELLTSNLVLLNGIYGDGSTRIRTDGTITTYGGYGTGNFTVAQGNGFPSLEFTWTIS